MTCKTYTQRFRQCSDALIIMGDTDGDYCVPSKYAVMYSVLQSPMRQVLLLPCLSYKDMKLGEMR